MKNMRKIISLALVLLLVAAFGTGCFGGPQTEYIGGDGKRTENSEDPDGGNGNGDVPADNPSDEVIDNDADSRTAFVSGAKTLMATQIMDLQGESSGGPMGVISDLLHDINNRSHEAFLSFAITDMVADGERSDDGDIFFNLGTAYDTGTADASLEISMGVGSEEATQSGIYLTGNTALLKSADVEKNIILYEMASDTDYTDMTFTDRLAGIMGSINGDTDTAGISDNAQTREELAARHLDPWMEETTPEEYTEEQQSRNILGSDVTCRVITLTMTGERAHTFLLEKMKALEADPDFSDMTGFLGGELTEELLADSASDGADTSQIITDLEAMTDEQIAELVFTASMVIYGQEAVGLGISLTSVDYDLSLDILAYERDLEHQLNLSVHAEGSTLTLDMTKISAGGDDYTTNMTMSAVDETGLETVSGQFGGTITQNDAEFAMDVDFSVNIRSNNEDTGSVSQSEISGTIDYTQPPAQDDGYTGEGAVTINIDSADTAVSVTLTLSVDVQFPGSVSINAPMYTESNVTRVSDEQGLYEALGLDWEELSQDEALSRVLSLVVAIVMG